MESTQGEILACIIIATPGQDWGRQVADEGDMLVICLFEARSPQVSFVRVVRSSAETGFVKQSRGMVMGESANGKEDDPKREATRSGRYDPTTSPSAIEFIEQIALQTN
jgi:hypothetical protein